MEVSRKGGPDYIVVPPGVAQTGGGDAGKWSFPDAASPRALLRPVLPPPSPSAAR
jgi:hypothetical protein